MVESVASCRRLNSSKQPQAPQRAKPHIYKICIKLKTCLHLRANAGTFRHTWPHTSSQLNTNTKRPSNAPKALTHSVLPVPAGPKGLPPKPIFMACVIRFIRFDTSMDPVISTGCLSVITSPSALCSACMTLSNNSPALLYKGPRYCRLFSTMALNRSELLSESPRKPHGRSMNRESWEKYFSCISSSGDIVDARQAGQQYVEVYNYFVNNDDAFDGNRRLLLVTGLHMLVAMASKHGISHLLLVKQVMPSEKTGDGGRVIASYRNIASSPSGLRKPES
uniref:Uncharacterized protein n=1 Tax=Glossina austeni TaxID=7395 RepID=A0A1A9VH62_GLOAU